LTVAPSEVTWSSDSPSSDSPADPELPLVTLALDRGDRKEGRHGEEEVQEGRQEVQEEEEETKGNKILNKFKKKEKDDEYTEAGINNGQIVSQVDNREKYMKTVISNDELLATLNKKYQAQYYIFINELDIKRGMESQYVNSSKVEDRTIKVHYTIFNNKEEVSSGAVITTFGGNENDINKIIKSQFGIIAEKIVNKIIPIEK